jgi:hypothetical protein
MFLPFPTQQEQILFPDDQKYALYRVTRERAGAILENPV